MSTELDENVDAIYVKSNQMDMKISGSTDLSQEFVDPSHQTYE